MEPAEIEQLQLGPTQEAVMSLLHPANLEINVVGDFDSGQVRAQADSAVLGSQ